MPTNDMNCLKKSTKETKFTNCKYKAPMLWKEICKELPETYQTTTVKVIAKKIGKKRAIQNVPKPIDTCHTRLGKENERRRNTKKTKQNLVSA